MCYYLLNVSGDDYQNLSFSNGLPLEGTGKPGTLK
jgi:hypothetical protein